MANRRMFSMDVVNTDKFLDMPSSTQALYFHLGMRADDDGFVSSPKRIAKTVNCGDDDLKLLLAKGYLIPFESGVVVISDWNVNNWIRPDRKHNTRFEQEKRTLSINNDVYVLTDSVTTICQSAGNQVTTKCHTEDRLGKDSIGKDNINIICPESKAPDRPPVITLILNDMTEYPVYQEDIDEWSKLYPSVDIIQELRKMRGWLDANPTNRKTKRGIRRFVNGWLSREQDKGGNKLVHKETPAEKRERERQANLAQWDEEQKNRTFHVPPVAPEDAAF